MPEPHALTLAAFLALAGQCGEGIAPTTLAQLTSAESSFNPLAININPGSNIKPGTVKGIKNKSQAIAMAKSLIIAGVNFDAGVAQINSKNFEWLSLKPETVFDPCENIKAQAHYLKSFSRYNTGSPTRGFDNGYVQKVIKEKSKIIAKIEETPTADVTEVIKTCPSAPKWAIGESVRYAKQCNGTTDVTIKRKVREYP